MTCKDCQHAAWQRAPKGGIQRGAHGTCTAPLPDATRLAACMRLSVSRLAIWPNDYEGCPAFTATQPKGATS